MREYAIGLDIGISSVGWAIAALDANEQPCGIEKMGVRIFDTAEVPKTGASLAAPRRAARSARRRLRRHRHRNQRIRYLLLSEGILSQNALDHLFDGKLEDIYEIRVKALDHLLSSADFARLLIHLSQRRGFRSNRKNPADKEAGAILAAVSKNTEELEKGKYRTVGEMLLNDPRFAEHKRNKGGEYIATVSRQQHEDEVRRIFDAQRRFGATFASTDIEEKYLAILLSQRSFDEGPGGNSPYGGNQIEKMVGKCTFFPDQPRAAKASYSFEYFTLLEKINHIRILYDGKSSCLTAEQRNIIINLALTSADVNYQRIRTALSIPDTARFNLVRYRDDFQEAEKRQKLGCMAAYHEMRRSFDKIAKNYIHNVSIAHRNAIATALTLYRTSEKISAFLHAHGVPQLLIDTAENLKNFSKFGHISTKACDLIIPHLEKGLNYNEACAAASIEFRGHVAGEKTQLLHPTDDDYSSITSPVAKRAISQAFKVINAIIRRQGKSPMFINIELAREMAKDIVERRSLEKNMLENQAANERIMDRLRKEFGLASPTGQDLVKLKLYEQQGGVCPYSQKQMSLAKIFDQNYAEIDHVVPYSLSFDNSYKNKVLVLASENRNKGNRLPLQYLTGKRREDYIVWVRSSIKDYRKQQLLLKEAITKEDEERFKERNLHDTQTASRFILNYLKDNLQFAPSASGKQQRVSAVNGAVTSQLRARWGIQKIRANGDMHHAVDALVVVCTTNRMIQQISKYSSFRETRNYIGADKSYLVDEATGEVISGFPYPWPHFRKELEGHLSRNPARFLADLRLPMYVSGELSYPSHPIFISRMPKRKVSGAAHLDTIKSPRLLEDNKLIVSRPLQDLTAKNIAFYYNPDSDRLLYNAIVERLNKFDGNGKLAFADVFRKPKRDGTPGPIVKKVKLWEPSTSNVSVLQGKGAADNDTMVRVDVFYVEDDGYYLVPIYVADTLKPQLPNLACIQRKPQSEWKVMQDEDFLFSLYHNDLICIKGNKPISFSKTKKDSNLPDTQDRFSEMVYYQSMNISSGAIRVLFHDGAYEKQSLGVKTLACIEKYTVDVLGEYHKVTKEKRQPFSINHP